MFFVLHLHQQDVLNSNEDITQMTCIELCINKDQCSVHQQYSWRNRALSLHLFNKLHEVFFVSLFCSEYLSFVWKLFIHE